MNEGGGDICDVDGGALNLVGGILLGVCRLCTANVSRLLDEMLPKQLASMSRLLALLVYDHRVPKSRTWVQESVWNCWFVFLVTVWLYRLFITDRLTVCPAPLVAVVLFCFVCVCGCVGGCSDFRTLIPAHSLLQFSSGSQSRYADTQSMASRTLFLFARESKWAEETREYPNARGSRS